MSHSHNREQRHETSELHHTKNTSPAELLKQAGNQNIRVRRKMAKNPNTLAKALLKLADDRDEWVRIHVAKNPNTPAVALQQLANDHANRVRKSAAKNLNASVEVHTSVLIYSQKKLARSASDMRKASCQHIEVRNKMTGHPNTPAAVLQRRAGDPATGVRKYVTRHTYILKKMVFQRVHKDAGKCARE
ncbi:hypothetical protein AGMMS50256_17450 [Betaproteobacteria bacterium]|nr:hypothetical protein AGMMS50256_17450 [Betaproteobacteria bacterium]